MKKKLNLFNNYPLNHSLDKKAIKKFIQLADPEVKEICKKIFDNTDYISFEFFFKKFNKCIKEFLNFIGNKKTIYIFIDIEKQINKSNYWLYNYLKKYIDIKIIIINNVYNEFLKDDDIIIFIDDCIYSGDQMAKSIYSLNNKQKLKLNIYILVPFISNEGKNNIILNFNKKANRRNYCKLIFPSNYNIPKIATDILTKKEIKLIEKYYNGYLYYLEQNYLIYFNHKLADPRSTITIFYIGFIPNMKNKLIFKQMNNKQIIFNEFVNYIDIIKSFDIIPVIKNCNNIFDNLNLWSTNCPHPPYKNN